MDSKEINKQFNILYHTKETMKAAKEYYYRLGVLHGISFACNENTLEYAELVAKMDKFETFIETIKSIKEETI